MKIIVLSDTHNHLPANLAGLLEGCDLILHAGDFTDNFILKKLEAIAPLIGVRGNCDTGVLASLPASIFVERGGESILMLHNLNHLQESAIPGQTTLIICGHTHVPVLTEHRGRRYLNPGSLTSPRGGSSASFATIDTDTEPASIHFTQL